MLREDAQLSGVLDTFPQEAVRNEVAPVAPDPPFPHLIRRALRENWATPDVIKRKVVAELLEAFFAEGADPNLRIQLFRTLLLADQTQYERDHPEEAGKANVQAVAILNELIEREHNFATDKPAT